jgi:hypothetical protein
MRQDQRADGERRDAEEDDEKAAGRGELDGREHKTENDPGPPRHV